MLRRYYHRWRASLVALGLALLGSACAHHSGFLPPPEQLADLPAQRLLGDVPFYPQDDYQCGPAALAMLLNYQGLAVSPEHLREQVYLPARRGSLQVEMVASARTYGLLAYPLAPRLEALLHELDAGHPVLVLQNLGFHWRPQWHYAVVIGYDLERAELVLHSGLQQAVREPFRLFMRTWMRADGWAQVLLPPGQVPASAEPMTFLRAASDLEQLGNSAGAEQAYRAALARWPGQPGARFGLGNIAWAEGRLEESARYFRGLAEDLPHLQIAWNNLGVVLAELACPQAAAYAMACATNRVPDTEHTALEQDSRCALPLCPN